MRLITLLVIIGCLVMTGCRDQPADPPPAAATSISGETGPAGGGDPRAGRKDRPQRPELEE